MFDNQSYFQPVFVERKDLYDHGAMPIGSAHLPFRSGRRICARPKTETFQMYVTSWTRGQCILVQNTEWQSSFCMIEDIETDDEGTVHLLLRMLAIADER